MCGAKKKDRHLFVLTVKLHNLHKDVSNLSTAYWLYLITSLKPCGYYTYSHI